jgi:hypothetical protein
MGRCARLGVLLATIGIFAVFAAAPVTTASAAGSTTPSPCSLLTRAEIAKVMTGRPGPPRTETAIPYPPGGQWCSWLSKDARKKPKGVLQAVVQLWDFRNSPADFRQQYGTRAKRFVHQRCTQKAPAGSGVELPKTKNLAGVGDTACTANSSVDVAKGPYFLIVTAGSLDEGAEHVGAAVQLANDALRRLHG